MSFEVKVKADDKDKTKKKIGVTITQDGKPFYDVDYTWTGIKDENQERFGLIIGELLGSVGILPDGSGKIGPIEEDDMIALEIGMTKVSKRLNEWAIEDAKGKGRVTAKAERALAAL